MNSILNFTINQSAPNILDDINSKLKDLGFSQDDYFDGYMTTGEATKYAKTISTEEKQQISIRIKNIFVQVIQDISTKQNKPIHIDKITVFVDSEMKLVASNTIKEIEYSIFNEYNNITVNP